MQLPAVRGRRRGTAGWPTSSEWMEETGARAHRARDGRAGSTPTSPTRGSSPPGRSSTGPRSSPPPTRIDRLHRRRPDPADRLDAASTSRRPQDDPTTHGYAPSARRYVQVVGRRVRAGRRPADSRGCCWDSTTRDWAEPEPTNFELSRHRTAAHDAWPASVGDGPLPGGAAGHAARDGLRARSRSGFVLTYKTSGVFNLAFGAQAYVSAAMYFKAHDGVGLGRSSRRSSSRWSCWRPLLGLVLERLDLPPPPHGAGAWPSSSSPSGCPSRSRPRSTCSSTSRRSPGATPGGHRPRRRQRLLRPVRRLRVQPQRAGGHGRRRRRHARRSARCSGSPRSACGCGRSSRARG